MFIRLDYIPENFTNAFFCLFNKNRLFNNDVTQLWQGVTDMCQGLMNRLLYPGHTLTGHPLGRVIDIDCIQWGSKYRTFEYQKHKTG